jgi:N,N-dimethylformamidase
LHAEVVNLPTRGVMGSGWTGAEHCWRHAPEDYAAVHFHSDDLDDVQWDTDFSFEVPEDLRSGVYAMRLQGEHSGHKDTIPFFVPPPLGKPPLAGRLCVVIPTFTYVIYGNHARVDFDPEVWHHRAGNLQ